MPPVNRNSNPFASCWTSPRTVEYVPLPEALPATCVARLAECGWWGQIVGPHGSGKTTLLQALEPLVQAEKRRWIVVRFHAWPARDQQRLWAWQQLLGRPIDSNTLLVVDGYEQLAPPLRVLVQLRCWWNRCGLLVTTHQSVGLPTIVQVAPELPTIRQVFRNLVAGANTPVDETDLQDAFNACKGDIRQLLSNLYDLHERRWRDEIPTNRQVAQVVVQTMDT